MDINIPFKTTIDEESLKQEYELLEKSNLPPVVKERAKLLLRLTLEIEKEVETKRKMQQGSMEHWREKMVDCFINQKRWHYLEEASNWELIENRLWEMRRVNHEEARSVFERENEGGYALRMQHKFTGIGILQEIHVKSKIRYSLQKHSLQRERFVPKSTCDWE